MTRRRGLVVAGVVLGTLAWWSLRDQDTSEPAQAGSLASPGSEGRDRAARADRAPLPTRTEDDAARPSPPTGSRLPPENPHEVPHLTCRLSETLQPTTAAVYLDWGDQRHLIGQPTVVGDRVSLPMRRESGELVLHLAGFEPLPLRWSTQGRQRVCAGEPLQLVARDEMRLSGRVLNTAGNPEPDARVTGCGPARVAADGTFTVSPVRAPCTLQAARQDGYWFSRSDPEEVRWQPDGDYTAELVLNEYPRGGMGISVETVDLGIRVSQVHPDTPAAAAGLQSGDVIVGLEGEPTVDFDLEQFIERATGEAGTDVTVSVLATDGTEREVTLTRAMLGP